MLSPFKTLGAVVCLVFALCFAAPNAVADQFVYTVTSTLSGLSTQFSFIEPTIPSSGTVISGLTQISGVTATGLSWNSAVDGLCSTGIGFISFSTSGCAAVLFSNGATSAPFPGGSLLAPGTYTTNFIGTDATLTVNIAQTGVPEPSSLALMLSRVGLVFAMRKRIGKGLSQAQAQAS
jgi:hypothetical protein